MYVTSFVHVDEKGTTKGTSCDSYGSWSSEISDPRNCPELEGI